MGCIDFSTVLGRKEIYGENLSLRIEMNHQYGILHRKVGSMATDTVVTPILCLLPSGNQTPSHRRSALFSSETKGADERHLEEEIPVLLLETTLEATFRVFETCDGLSAVNPRMPLVLDIDGDE